MEKLNIIAKELIEMTEEEMQESYDAIMLQVNYTHPLNQANANRIRKIGEHNLKTFSAFKELRRVLIEENPFKEVAE